MKEFKGVWIPYEILTDIKLNDKEKISNNKIYNKNSHRYKSERDYSNFDWTSLYSNDF